MARTALAYLQTLLENEWTDNWRGRIEPVPKPEIVIAGDVNTKRVSNANQDVIFVRDGGTQSITPQSVGWTSKRIETMSTIDIRTSQSRARLEGVRDDNNEAENYGGLRGEVERILDLVRKGDKEYDWIDGYEWNDLSEDVGFKNWRGTWEVRHTQIAEQIDEPLDGYGSVYGESYGEL